VLPPTTVTVEVTVGAHFPPRRKGGPTGDGAGRGDEFQLVFFHARGDGLAKLLPTGQRRLVSGKVELFDGIAQMVHPDHVLRPEEAGDLPPSSRSIRWRRPDAAGGGKAAQAALARAPDLPEWIDRR
jgi:ATP-dependent DNA helicase RecG